MKLEELPEPTGPLCGHRSRPLKYAYADGPQLSCQQPLQHLGRHKALTKWGIHYWHDDHDSPFLVEEGEPTDRVEVPELDIRPRDVPRLREMMRDFWTTEAGQTYLELTISQEQWLIPERFVGYTNRDVMLDFLTGRAVRPWTGAPAYFVVPEMLDVAAEAAEELGDDWTFATADLPSPSGLMVVGKPLPYPAPISGVNPPGSRYLYEVITWEPAEYGYDDVDDRDASFVEFWSGPASVPYERMGALGLRPYLPDNEGLLIDGKHWKYTHLDPQLRLLYVLFRLMQQRLTRVGPAELDRAARRGAHRADVPAEVTLITLRQIEPPREHTHRPVDWAGRWLVSGHWRSQYFPSRKAHAPVWIDSYIKGDPKAPLLPPKSGKVYVLKR